MLISVPTASADGIGNVISWSMARGVPVDPTLSPESKGHNSFRLSRPRLSWNLWAKQNIC